MALNYVFCTFQIKNTLKTQTNFRRFYILLTIKVIILYADTYKKKIDQGR
jgi:hypothetical protein